MSVFLAIGLFAVFMIIGLSVDGAGQLFAMQRAHNIAAEAARAGGQSIDEGQAIEGGRKVLDPAAAVAAAKAYREAAGATGAEPVVDPDGQAITVQVDLVYQPVMLRFFGWQREIVVRETATARLLDAPTP
ncbi:pilus assembly protein TadG-related protein [Micromonospora zhanjiangensis]|uniref:Pilus assembly protein TadG-related protein n=1 Tax=Micromonospora zhanjiangensis TaxID=1522057 RepID=A0ABV8KUD3_9ACTN